MNDNAIEAVIDKDQEIAEQFGEQVHWQTPQCPGEIDQASAAPASAWSMARAFVLPMRSATSRAAPLSTMGVVTIGQLTLFSSETGDAWIIDRDDHLALRLACQGDPEPFHIEETDTSFAIDWKGHYRIEGQAFVYTERATGRITISVTQPFCSNRKNDRKISNIFG
jgi:hypothetical protein